MRYAWQRDSVTYIVIFIVMMSFIYLAIVMGNEITGYTPECLVSCFRSRQNALLSAANTIQNQKDDNIEMNFLNPAMAGRYVLLLCRWTFTVQHPLPYFLYAYLDCNFLTSLALL